MYIINLSLFILSTIYIYSLSNLFSFSKGKKTQLIVFLIYSLVSFFVLLTIKDLYYFYLMYKLLNICIYMILINLSYNPINFRYLIYYYFIRFVSSLLFIISLYDLSNNLLSVELINISILIKLSLYPFSNIISNIYKNVSFNSYLILNYYINYLYLIILFYINSLSCDTGNFFLSFLVFFFSFCTLIYSGYNFNKQHELKGAVAYSSIVNLPITITPFLLIPLVSSHFSQNNLVTLLTFTGFYLIVYSNNIFILNLFSYSLEPIKGKK